MYMYMYMPQTLHVLIVGLDRSSELILLVFPPEDEVYIELY